MNKGTIPASVLLTKHNGINHTVTLKAAEKVKERLTSYGNEPDEHHQKALYLLCHTYTEIAQKKRTGRWAFSLAAGMGKTSTIIDWCAALCGFEGGEHIGVSVASSQIESLCELKRDMIKAGVPEERIGLLHNSKHDVEGALAGKERCATEPSTGNDSRQIMLITHERIKSNYKDKLKFMTYEGKDRELLIWDEALTVSSSSHININILRGEIQGLEGRYRHDQKFKDLIDWSASVMNKIDKLRFIERTIKLKQTDVRILDRFKSLTAEASTQTDEIEKLLRLANDRLRITKSAQGGLLWYEIVVPAEYKNIVILDASYPISTLIKLDKTIKDANELPSVKASGCKKFEQLKRYDNCTLYYATVSGSHMALVEDFSKHKGQRQITKDIIEIMTRHPNEAILIVTFKKRKGKSKEFKEIIEQDLEEAGINLKETVEVTKGNKTELKPRINIITYGKHTGFNNWSYCSVGVLAGSYIKPEGLIASEILGQSDNLEIELDKEIIEYHSKSSTHSDGYQALNRTHARDTIKGQAPKTTFYVYFKDESLKDSLVELMTGLKTEKWTWSNYWLNSGSMVDLIAEDLKTYLVDVSKNIKKLSTSNLKKLTGHIDKHSKTFTRAIDRCLKDDSIGWVKDGRSVVRKVDYYFG